MLERGRLKAVDEDAFKRDQLADVMAAVDRDYAQLVVRQKPAIAPLLEANRNLKNANLGVKRLVNGVAE